MKNMNEMINVDNNLYFILPVYVSLGTWNNPVNHLPIAVSGIKLDINKERIKAMTKLVNMLSQSIVANEIVNTPSLQLDCALIADVRQRKNETGMSHIKLYTNNDNLNFIGHHYKMFAS